MSKFFLFVVIVSLIVLPCDGFEISVDAVSSSTISISWEIVSGANEIRVLLAADYVLGANPPGMVMVTGLGSVSPKEPLHLDSLIAEIEICPWTIARNLHHIVIIGLSFGAKRFRHEETILPHKESSFIRACP